MKKMRNFYKIMRMTGAVKVVAKSNNMFVKNEYVKFRMWHPVAWLVAICLFIFKVISMIGYTWKDMCRCLEQEYRIQEKCR